MALRFWSHVRHCCVSHLFAKRSHVLPRFARYCFHSLHVDQPYRKPHSASHLHSSTALSFISVRAWKSSLFARDSFNRFLGKPTENQIKIKLCIYLIIRQIISCLNSLWWDKNISLETKKRLGKAMVESVACYGCEVWLLKREKQSKALEMDHLWKSARVSRLQKNLKHHH